MSLLVVISGILDVPQSPSSVFTAKSLDILASVNQKPVMAERLNNLGEICTSAAIYDYVPFRIADKRTVIAIALKVLKEFK